MSNILNIYHGCLYHSWSLVYDVGSSPDYLMFSQVLLWKLFLFRVSLKATNSRHWDHFKFTAFPWKRDSIKPESLYVKWNTLNPLINYLNYNLMSFIASIYSSLVFFLPLLLLSVTKWSVCDIYLTFVHKVLKVHYWLCIINVC